MIPTVLFVAESETGKTTLVEAVIRGLKGAGLRVLAVKHTRHAIQADREGSDSWRFARAGADVTLAVSPGAVAAFMAPPPETTLASLLERFSAGMDVAVVEGGKDEPLPKIEVHRTGYGRRLICRDGSTPDPHLIAVASDGTLESDPGVPLLPLNDPSAVVAFLMKGPFSR